MKIEDIIGSGKGGGSHTPTEAINTLQSDSIISVLEVISEGEIEGLVAGKQSIYFDGSPLENPDNSKNFDVESDYRYGLPDQSYMQGWPSAESLIDKNLNIKTGVDGIHASTDIDIDAIKLIISLPNGLSKQESNGDLNGTTVNFAVYTADASGVYQHYQTLEINGKTTSPFFRTYRVERPQGSTGLWSLKVVRITPDAENQQTRNDLVLAQVVEIKDVKLQFNDTAYVGLRVSAKSVSNKIPVRSYHIKGIKIQVPTNYDPITATYSGQWDGSFKNAWSDNPSWILYDILTNDRYGCGQWIKAADVDVYSFYDAGVYNDELVTNGKGAFERRFTFNGIINNQDDAIKTLSLIAGSFNAVLLQEGRLYRVQQDRPSSPVAILTNANVIDGSFIYAGSPHQSRHTVVNVTYQDKTNKYKEQIATVEAAQSELERYNGINKIDIKAIGAVTESQAMRAGKWHIETELNQKETVSFSMSFNGFDLRIGDVVKIADRNIKTLDYSGRILNAVSDANNITVTLDRPVTYNYGDAITYINTDNKLSEIDIASSNNETNTILLPVGSDLPKIGGVFSFESIVKDRQFRITGYTQSAKNVIDFTGIEHDPNKYARVEQGLDIPSSIYSSSIFNRSVNAPTDIKFSVNAYVNDESIRRDLVVSWAQSINTAVSYYNVSWRVNNGNWTSARAESAYYDITNISEGVYDVKVTANGIDGATSTALTGTYTHTLNGGTGSNLNPVTNLTVKGSGGTVFDGKNLDIQFTNPSTNLTDLAVLKDFRVDIKDLSDNIVRSDYVARVDAGAIQYYTYSFDLNQYDFGDPKRSFKVTVYCRDTDNKLSVGTTKTFTNPVPIAPQVTVKSGVNSLMIETNISSSKDYAGTVIYASQTSGFVPSAANKIYQGSNTFYVHENISGTWYYKAAHYDTFDAGDLSGLSYSAEVSGITATTAGIPTGSVLPVTPIGTEYSFYLDTTDDTKGLYGWDGTKWIKVSNLSDLSNATGKISTTQINDNAITTPKIATNSITSNLIVAGAVTADKLTVNNLAAINANMGAITSGSITLDSTGFIRGGATSYSVGSGIWQGYDNGNYKWRVGTPGSSRAEWNGSSFNIYDGSGNLTISSGVVDYTKISGKPSSLSGISSAEGSKLSGIQSGATVGAPSGTYVGSTLAQYVEANASNAITAVNDMSSDDRLTPTEKQQTKKELDEATALYNKVIEIATTAALTTSKTALINAYTSLTTYINPLVSSLTTTSSIVGTTFRAKWSDFYTSLQECQNQATYVASSTAQWPNVGGSGRPEDFATKGATIGGNLYGTFTTSNIGTFMPSAVIGSAQILDAAINNAKIGNAEIGTLKIAGEAVTVSRSAYTIGQTAFTASLSGANWVDLQSVYINPDGGTVTCIGSIQLTAWGGQYAPVTLGLRVVAPSGSVVAVSNNSLTLDTNGYLTNNLTVTGIAYEAGTYRLQGQATLSWSTNPQGSNRFLLLLSTKR